jgi:Co/Zn/Cd efflux system component
MIAALGVWGTASGWPDLVVAGVMAGLFMNSATQIVRQALAEKKIGGSCEVTTPHSHSSS